MAGEKYVGDNRPDGMIVGQSAASYVGFFGTDPVVQPSGSGQDALTTSSSDSTALGELITLVTKIRTDLVALGLIKGSS
ncbi:MAG: hypothetical protein H8E94_03020 [Alphaproteobacteria bacterium]|nr:hypothetical protein [Alphaproteobacteria bacterium]